MKNILENKELIKIKFNFLKNEKNEGNILSRSVLPSIILSFFGIKNIQTISADQMSIDYEGSIKKAEEQISKIT